MEESGERLVSSVDCLGEESGGTDTLSLDGLEPALVPVSERKGDET